MQLTMDDAMEKLSSLISGRRAPAAETYASAFRAMETYLRVLDISDAVQELSVIHVAGTKGKGSTCAFVERILRCAGVRTGLYSSPHLIDVRERIRIDGDLVPEADFLREFEYCWSRLAQAKERDCLPMPAYFRFLTLLGLRLFVQMDVQVIVLEVGLGGRLDATNVIKRPMVCGITSIGYDHVEVLGNTLTQIAREKAGIFKPGVKAYTAPQTEEAMASLERCAESVGGVQLEIAKSLDAYQGSGNVKVEFPSVNSGSRPGMEIAKGSTVRACTGLRPVLGLAGAHQQENAALAVALCRAWYNNHRKIFPTYFNSALGAAETSLEKNQIPQVYHQGLGQTSWPGRSQIVVADQDLNPVDSKRGDADGKVIFFLDGAHTQESMAVCARWFADASRPAVDDVTNVLVFNCMPEREPAKLLKPVAHSRVAFHHAMFVPNDSSVMSVGAGVALSKRDTSWQQNCANTWTLFSQANSCSSSSPQPTGLAVASDATKSKNHPYSPFAGGHAEVLPTLSLAMQKIQKMARSRRHIQVLVTGSLHLVGDILKRLRKRAV